MELRNPYKPGNSVAGDPAFVGRDELLAECLRILTDRKLGGLLLFGQRRMGKTSLLNQLALHMRANPTVLPIVLTLEDKKDLPLGELLATLQRELFSAVGLAAPSSSALPARNFADVTLKQVCDTAGKRTPVLLLDEFDIYPEERGLSDVLAAVRREPLRSRMSIGLVIGRRVRDLTLRSGPLVKDMMPVRVSSLDRAESDALVRLSERAPTPGLRWRPEAVELVWTLAGGHPFLTQLLCTTVWETHHAAPPAGEVFSEYVAALAQKVLDRCGAVLPYVWDALPPEACFVASAMASAGQGPIRRDEIETLLIRSGAYLIQGQLESAPRLLEEWDLIHPVPGGAGLKFNVELIRRWIRQEHTLEDAPSELSKLSPEAEIHHRSALELLKRGLPEELEDALRGFNRAIDANPNHSEARLSRADALARMGRLDQALDELERLLSTRRSGARGRLLRYLMEAGRDATRSYEQRVRHLRRAMELDPESTEARDLWGGLHREQGDTAAAQGDWELAAQHYETGGLADEAGRARRRYTQERAAAIRAEIERLTEAGDSKSLASLLLESSSILKEVMGEEFERFIDKTYRHVRCVSLGKQAQEAVDRNDMQEALGLLSQLAAVDLATPELARLRARIAARLDAKQGSLTTGAVPPQPTQNGRQRHPALGLIALFFAGVVATAVILVIWNISATSTVRIRFESPWEDFSEATLKVTAGGHELTVDPATIGNAGVEIELPPGPQSLYAVEDTLVCVSCPGPDCPPCCAQGVELVSPTRDDEYTTVTMWVEGPRITPEVCDGYGVDEDCDGLVDVYDPDATGVGRWWPDEDGDGVGAIGDPVDGCQPTGSAFIWVTTTGDCNDRDATTQTADIDRDGHTAIACGGDDCLDTDARIHGGAEEILGNEVDEDCDGHFTRRLARTSGNSDYGYARTEFGFPFPFCGRTYDNAAVGSDGVVVFGDDLARAWGNLSSGGRNSTYIAPFWTDLVPPTNSITADISNKYDSIEINWIDVPSYNYGVPMSFSVVLTRHGEIRFRYGKLGPTNAVEVGLQCENAPKKQTINLAGYLGHTINVDDYLRARVRLTTTTGERLRDRLEQKEFEFIMGLL